ncbi:hypothetical protein [Persicobacter psychrovividus]|uniref:Uncharacterized protein n=1 Tax=Persicobacter psychrovividus TaxID=387638 RepID=A0ABN6LK20_9BACT|nr:hypothetical protein PEPS_40770 [Persicobacter psychrovividus]
MKKLWLIGSFGLLLFISVGTLYFDNLSNDSRPKQQTAISIQERSDLSQYLHDFKIDEQGFVVDADSEGAYFSLDEKDAVVTVIVDYYLNQGFELQSKKGTQDGNTYLVPLQSPLKGQRGILVKRYLGSYKVRIQ